MSVAKDPSFLVRHSRLSTFAATVVAVVAAGFGFVYSGLYDVSAASGHNPLVAWVLHKTYMQSLHRHAAAVQVPTDLMTVANVEAGARLYRNTCAACHGAPGQTLSPIGQGILPIAPELLSATRRNNPQMMFWVIKNGVKMTAMPAFGKTQDDQTIWDLTAFLYKGRGISAQDFEKLSASKPNTQP
ncbi:cytochrome c [Paraburkholderia sp. FT54]|jgi:mono/diheme cytochrome c family protein|uniref:c-type cytochrome n=1 Tax=Paraburkholderia sp. FT54 TaxID=3074437 RepID=UPI002877506C|nr:cytochrome c [Paraburkholderia sp. FT54]WNC93946.1 cytochrome c [Paraburkholderia sp. FT54]